MLAREMDFISQEQFITATEQWDANSNQPLDELMLECELIGKDDHELILALISELLAEHDDDPVKSLVAFSSRVEKPGEATIQYKEQQFFMDMMT
jgi:hypothetical protein